MTMEQLNDPEVILVVSMDLISSSSYQRYHYKQESYDDVVANEFKVWKNPSVENNYNLRKKKNEPEDNREVRQQAESFAKFKVQFHMLTFQRIVIDEGHECLS